METRLKPQRKSNSENRNVKLGKQIEWILERKRKCLDPEYTASQLRKELGINGHLLAATLKSVFGTNYAGLVNRYRIARACCMLEDPRYANARIEDMAAWLGFKSRQGFYLAFRAEKGVSPARYRHEAIPAKRRKDENNNT